MVELSLAFIMDWIVVFGMLQSVLEIIRNFFSCVLFYVCLCDVPPHLCKMHHSSNCLMQRATTSCVASSERIPSGWTVPTTPSWRPSPGPRVPSKVRTLISTATSVAAEAEPAGFCRALQPVRPARFSMLCRPLPHPSRWSQAQTPTWHNICCTCKRQCRSWHPVSSLFTQKVTFFLPQSLPPKHASRFQNLLSLDIFHPFYSCDIFKYLSLIWWMSSILFLPVSLKTAFATCLSKKFEIPKIISLCSVYHQIKHSNSIAESTLFYQ